MFCVVYEFKVKQGANEDFEKSWAEFTKAIYRVRGSLGSRLHKTKEPQTYIAYAQWPSREIFYQDVGKESYKPEEWQQREKMSAALESSKKVYELEVLNDLLQFHETDSDHR